MREKTLILPQGTVMAYKRKQLVFKENGWGKQRLKEADGERESASPQKRNEREGASACFHPLLCPFMEKAEDISQLWGHTHIPLPMAPSQHSLECCYEETESPMWKGAQCRGDLSTEQSAPQSHHLYSFKDSLKPLSAAYLGDPIT